MADFSKTPPPRMGHHHLMPNASHGAPVVGRKGPELVGRVEDAAAILPSPRARVGVAEPEALFALLATVATDLANRLHCGGALRLVREAHALVAARPGSASVAVVARTLGVSPRTLRRAFEAVTGSGPKTALRIVRLQRALRLLRGGHRAADVALDCGFADQAHLTNELRTLAGVTPAQVSRRSTAEHRAATAEVQGRHT